MNGPKEMRRFISRNREYLKGIKFDSLNMFKFHKDKKWRKTNRRCRDGSYGTAASFIEAR